MNISSVVITTVPEHAQRVKDSINSLDGCEVHFHDARGKIVVTIEGESTDAHMKVLRHIQNTRHVLSARLAYSYCEEELKKSFEHIGVPNNPVPDDMSEV